LNFAAFNKHLKAFDWRSLKKYTSPQAAEDLNVFLEKLPQHAGQTMIIIAVTVWAVAGGAGLYTTVQLQQLTELRAELQSAAAVQPRVPTIKDVAVDASEVQIFVENSKQIYKGLSLRSNDASIEVSAETTAAFGQFREAIGHIQNGGSGWRVSIEKFCVGRECKPDPLYAILKINKVSVQ
jgi:hypothetical protein